MSNTNKKLIKLFDRLPRKMLSSWVRTKCPIGAPEFIYGHGLYKSMTKGDVDVKNWYELALDKLKWRKIINDI